MNNQSQVTRYFAGSTRISAEEWQRAGLELVRWGARYGHVSPTELAAAEARLAEIKRWPKTVEEGWCRAAA